jgi:hypothetical protein
MFARVTTLEGGDPAKFDETMQFARDQILPRARQMEGWKGVISLGDRSSGGGLLITLWESEEAMNASADQGRALRAEGTAVTGGREGNVQGFEVLMLETE